MDNHGQRPMDNGGQILPSMIVHLPLSILSIKQGVKAKMYTTTDERKQLFNGVSCKLLVVD